MAQQEHDRKRTHQRRAESHLYRVVHFFGALTDKRYLYPSGRYALPLCGTCLKSVAHIV